METFMSQFEFDVYGFISVTAYKIVIIKNETKTNNLGDKPSDTILKKLIQKIQAMHSEMILNPFFEHSILQNSVGPSSNLLEDESEESNSDCSSCSSTHSGRGSLDKEVRPPVKTTFSAKTNNKECLMQLKQRID